MRKIVESKELGGAVFEGTRILVLNIQKALNAKGADRGQISRAFPALDGADLEAALAYKGDAKPVVKPEPTEEPTKPPEDPKPVETSTSKPKR